MHFGAVSGVCPAGGTHEAGGSFDYAMIVNKLNSTDQMQADWKSCHKCQGLFFGPFKGKCPAGGPHDEAGSFNYEVRFI